MWWVSRVEKTWALPARTEFDHTRVGTENFGWDLSEGHGEEKMHLKMRDFSQIKRDQSKHSKTEGASPKIRSSAVELG